MSESRFCGANKKMLGPKRHIAVDSDGWLLMVNLTTAETSSNAGAQVILDAIRKRWPWGVTQPFADGAYDPAKLLERAEFLDFVIELICPIAGEPGFKVFAERVALRVGCFLKLYACLTVQHGADDGGPSDESLQILSATQASGETGLLRGR